MGRYHKVFRSARLEPLPPLVHDLRRSTPRSHSVGSNERRGPMSRGGNRESVDRIGMEVSGQAYAIRRDHRFDWAQGRGTEDLVHPDVDVHRRPQPTLGYKERDLPRRVAEMPTRSDRRSASILALVPGRFGVNLRQPKPARAYRERSPQGGPVRSRCRRLERIVVPEHGAAHATDERLHRRRRRRRRHDGHRAPRLVTVTDCITTLGSAKRSAGNHRPDAVVGPTYWRLSVPSVRLVFRDPRDPVAASKRRPVTKNSR